MGRDSFEERRKYERYDTEVKIYYHISYDVKTKVKYQIIDEKDQKGSSRKYLALSKDVSAEGLCFASGKQLQEGDHLHLEVYLATRKDPIHMEGEVRWSQPIDAEGKNFNTGVLLLTVDGESVPDSIYFDETEKIIWSSVLESVFGGFRKFIQKKWE